VREECADLEHLQSAWLDEQLSAPDRVRVAAHLDGCAGCQDRLESLARTRSLLRSMPVRQIPVSLLSRVQALMPVTEQRPHVRLARRVAAVCAVFVGLVGGAAFGLGGQPHPAPQVVRVPVDVYAVDHLVRTVGQPLSTPVLVNGP